VIFALIVGYPVKGIVQPFCTDDPTRKAGLSKFKGTTFIFVVKDAAFYCATGAVSGKIYSIIVCGGTTV